MPHWCQGRAGIADLDEDGEIRDKKGKYVQKYVTEKISSLGLLKPLKVCDLSRLGALLATHLGRGSNAPTSDEGTQMAAILKFKKKIV